MSSESMVDVVGIPGVVSHVISPLLPRLKCANLSGFFDRTSDTRRALSRASSLRSASSTPLDRPLWASEEGPHARKTKPCWHRTHSHLKRRSSFYFNSPFRRRWRGMGIWEIPGEIALEITISVRAAWEPPRWWISSGDGQRRASSREPCRPSVGPPDK